MASPPFEIPARPRRRYPYSGGVEYEGETVFTLSQSEDLDDDRLEGIVETVLDGAGYTCGDWFDLPMALFLVHDDETGDVFRVGVRDGTVELHVLPATESAGLRRFYERLDAESGVGWSVDCRVERP